MGEAAGLAMLLGTGTQVLGQGYNTYAQSSAMLMQGDYAKRMGNLNAGMYDMRADDSILRGEREAARLGMQTRQLIGAQRASAAAGGVDVNSGSPLNLQTDAAGLSAIDQNTIRNNAWKEAMGLKMQGQIERNSANMAYTTSRFNATNTMISGGLQMAGTLGQGLHDYYRYTPPMRVPDVNSYYAPSRNVNSETYEVTYP